MDRDYAKDLELLVRKYKERGEKFFQENPYGVPISTGGWGGNGFVVAFANKAAFYIKLIPTSSDLTSR